MTSKRVYFVLLAAIGLMFISLLAGTYGANQLLAKESDKLTTYKAKSRALDQQQQSLRSAKQDIERFADLEKIAKVIVPEDKNQAAAVREIVNIAAANEVALGSITFPASTLGGTNNNSQQQKAPSSPKSSSPSGALSQLQPIKNIPGVYQLTITITGDEDRPVQYNQFLKFLAGLERNRRTAQVTSIVLQPDTDNPNLLTFTVTLNQFIKP